MTVNRPILRYHGGKWRLAPWIISHFPPHRVYVEPYGGAGSVLLRKPPARAEIYNDLDEDVVTLFRVLRDAEKAEQLRRLLELTPYSRLEFYATYETTDDPVERARRVVARCAMAFGSTSRGLRSTGFRATPIRGRSTTGVADWCSFPRHVPAIIERLRHVIIECRDALEVIRQQDHVDTLFYLDPPYPISTRSAVRSPRQLRGAYFRDLTDDDHRELSDTLHAIKGMAVVSGYPCPLYDDEFYPDWTRIEKESLGDAGARRTEVLYLNRSAMQREGLFHHIEAVGG